MTNLSELLDQLRRPFHPSHIIWKPGAVKGDRALAMPYADLRAYMDRLDEVCGSEWEVAYEPWGADRIICRLTIAGVTRSSTGETTNESEKSEIGGTVAEAQSFKRASAMFGLGRYLYNLPSGWADYDPATRKFTDKAKAKLTGILVQHYRRATEGKGEVEIERVDTEDAHESPPHQRLFGQGASAFGPDWDNGARAWLISNWTAQVAKTEIRDSASDLSDTEKDQLADYIAAKLKKLQDSWLKHKAAMLQATAEPA